MTGFAKLAVLGGLLAASAAPAFADSISVFDAAAGASITSSSINFGLPQPQAVVLTNTFSFLTAAPVSFAAGTFTFNTNGSTAITPFVIAKQGTTTYTISSVTESTTVNGTTDAVTLMGHGYFTLTGGQQIFADYVLQNGGSGVSFQATATASATPEPSSLMLLGTGLLSAGGMLFRKRLKA